MPDTVVIFVYLILCVWVFWGGIMFSIEAQLPTHPCTSKALKKWALKGQKKKGAEIM